MTVHPTTTANLAGVPDPIGCPPVRPNPNSTRPRVQVNP